MKKCLNVIKKIKNRHVWREVMLDIIVLGLFFIGLLFSYRTTKIMKENKRLESIEIYLHSRKHEPFTTASDEEKIIPWDVGQTSYFNFISETGPFSYENEGYDSYIKKNFIPKILPLVTVPKGYGGYED